MSEKYRRELVKRIKAGKLILEIDGYYNQNTPYGKYEWYDIFHRGQCLNEGDPFHAMPTKAQIEVYLKSLRKEYVAGMWKGVKANPWTINPKRKK